MKAVSNVPFYSAVLCKLTEIARSRGYALCVHGSLERDLDVIAIPWMENVADPECLAAVIADAVEGEMPLAGKPKGDGSKEFVEVDMRFPESKPHGRYVWTIVLKGGLFIDFGVIAPSGWTPQPAHSVPRHIKQYD